jgi:PAS domain S-box-containing protein
LANEQIDGAALAEAGRFARSSLDALSAHVAVLDERGRVIATNRAWRAFAEANQQRWEQVSEGVNYLGVCDQASAAGAEGAGAAARGIRDVMAGRQAEVAFEYECHAPGEERWFLCRITRFEGDGPVRVVLAHENITPARQAEREVRALNADLERRVLERTASLADETEKLRAVLATAVDAIITIDERGRIESFNPAAERMFGYAAGEVLGQNVSCLMPQPHAGAHDGYLRSYLQTGQAKIIGIGREVQCKRRDGSLFPAELAISEARLGERRLFAGILHDISERKRAEASILGLNAELALRAAELEAANKSLESFSYSVSHDLRAPLRHIQGYAELLAGALEGELSQEAGRYLTVIGKAGREMGQLIDDLLEFSRMGRAAMRESRVDLDGLVRSVIANLEMATRGRKIEWNIPALPRVIGDASMLRQVLANLLSNAVKYTGPRDPARIEIACAGEDNGRIILFVRDNGVGFDMKYADKLFGVFQRLHRSNEFEGTGIGLASVERIIARHGGRVWAEAAPDLGATFYITLLPAPKA